MSSLLFISLPSLSSLVHSPQGAFYPDFVNGPSAYHQHTHSHRMPAYHPDSLPGVSDKLGIAQPWHHLNNKNSQRLQSGGESLSQMARMCKHDCNTTITNFTFRCSTKARSPSCRNDRETDQKCTGSNVSGTTVRHFQTRYEIRDSHGIQSNNLSSQAAGGCWPFHPATY